MSSMWEHTIPKDNPVNNQGSASPPQYSPQLTEGGASAIREFEELVMNVLSSRQQFFSQFFDPRRDLYKECGYPSHGEEAGTVEQYQELYDREAVAARCVDVLPEQTWQIQPTVYEDEDPTVSTAFEQAWDNLGRNLMHGGESSYQNEAGSPVWEYLKRIDTLSGIGQYGILYLGINDLGNGRTPQEPVNPGSDNQLLFVRCFPERLATIASYETNEFSPRFGQPLTYTVTFNDPRQNQQGIGVQLATRTVHWSRVIHVADNLGSSEVCGTPRMRPVLNRLLDLQKLYGGSAEMYWRGAFPGVSFETHPTLGAEAVRLDKVGLKDQMEAYMNGLQRYMALTGMTAKSLAPQVVDPSPQILCQIDAICIKLGIPKRIFMGSERGELASSQDDSTWNDRLRERQRSYVTPRIIVPFVDRLIQLGVLPKPKGFSVWWPDLTSQTSQEKSQIAFQRTQALTQYWSAQAMGLVPPLEYLVTILGLDEDEAVSIVESARKWREENKIDEPPVITIPAR